MPQALFSFPMFRVVQFLLGPGLFSATEARSADQQTDVPIPRVIEYPWMSLEKWRWFHEGDLERARSGPVGVLFLGDSITECWDTRGLEIWNEVFEPL